MESSQVSLWCETSAGVARRLTERDWGGRGFVLSHRVFSAPH